MTDTKNEIILSILKANTGHELTCRNLLNEMSAQEHGQFTGGGIAIARTMEELKKKGLIENGISVIVKGKTQLTWKLAKQKKTTVDELIAEKLKEKIATETPTEPKDDGGCLLLNPDDQIESAFIEIVSALRELKAAPLPVTVDNKTYKIKTLLQLSDWVAEDIKTALFDVIQVLEKLEEAV